MGDTPMGDSIMVVDADRRTCRSMCNLLEAHRYLGIPSHSLANLERLIEKNSCRAMIVDLDTVPVNNRRLRDLKKTYPDLYVLAISGRSFHPELKEAMVDHIYACLSKPVDVDELGYWLKSIFMH